MLALLSEMARAEKETMVERIKSGIGGSATQRSEVGKAEGTKLANKEFLVNHKDILKQLRSGQSVRNTAKIVGKSASTVQRVKLAMAPQLKGSLGSRAECRH